MRMVLGLAALLTCLAAQPATAREEPASPGGTPAPTAAFSLASAPIPPDFRLHAASFGTTSSDLVADVEGKLRHRVASAMMEFYPSEGSGFHLSGGTRMFQRTNFMAEAEKFTQGLLYAPRGLGNASLRSGFKRFTPAMTAGYTQAIRRDLTLGVEAGSLLGRAYNGLPGRLRSGGAGAGAGLNPIMNLVVGARF